MSTRTETRGIDYIKDRISCQCGRSWYRNAEQCIVGLTTRTVDLAVDHNAFVLRPTVLAATILHAPLTKLPLRTAGRFFLATCTKDYEVGKTLAVHGHSCLPSSLTQLTSSQPCMFVSGVVTTSGLARMAHMLNSVRYLHSPKQATSRTAKLTCCVCAKMLRHGFLLDVALV